MAEGPTRRAFLKQTSAVAALFAGTGRSSTTRLVQAGDPPWASLPRLDGDLLLDASSRDEMAVDLGRHTHRVPTAVLKPGSVADVVKVVRFANRHRLRVAMRGRGHSQFGQALVDRGIVVDSRTLKAVRLSASASVEAQAGAAWEDVIGVALTRGLTPPALGDTMTLSVGGILSAGGVSNSSHLYGGVADSVQALDVVTGSGELVPCSPARNRELFELALAGMGQCGIIVNARLRLVPAPQSVVRCDLVYDDLSPFLTDATRLAIEARVDHLGTYIEPSDRGRGWRFRINIGKFRRSPQDVDFAPIETGLRFVSRTEPVVASYVDYLHREATRNEAAEAVRRTTPSHLLSVMMFIPDAAAEKLLRSILDMPSEAGGLTRFSANPIPTRLFTRPMFVLPQAEVAYVVYLFRSVPIADQKAYTLGMEALRRLVGEMRAVGGNTYPPNAPFFSRAEWMTHYGPMRWHRLVAGKTRFDPLGVLTPGPGMFST